jgi:hypothetical protein
MSNIRIPHSLAGIDAGFIAQLIRQVHPDAEVETVEITGEIHGTATKARLRLRYAKDVGAPEVVWLKAGYEPHSASLHKDGIYALEPKVYAELLPDLPVRAPRQHGAIYDEQAGEGIVLIADLGANAQIHSPESHIAPAAAAAMLEMLAQMHGATSRPGWLEARPWIKPVHNGFGEAGSYLTYMADPAQIERFLQWPRAAEYPPAMRDPQAISAGLRRVFAWSKALTVPCMIHGDAHVGNSYADAQGRPGLLDWQCVRRGGWAFDVAYYMGSALSIEDRRACERDLLEGYWKAFENSGGVLASREAAWQDYLVCLGYGFAAWLSNDPSMQPERFNTIVSNRFAWALADHNVISASGGAGLDALYF